MPFSAYLVWRFRPGQRDAARHWLADVAERLMRVERGAGKGPSIQALKAADGTNPRAINLALTASGLRKLDLDDRRLRQFSLEFLEGMAPKPTVPTQIPRRSNLLGDAGDSLPAHWNWGGWSDDDVDGMLLLYAADEPTLHALVNAEIQAMKAAAEPVADRRGSGPVILKGRLYDDRKEHFGFKDGISQPTIEGSPLAKRSRQRLKQKTSAAAYEEEGGKALSEKGQRISLVKPGEFLLGYVNERRECISDGSARGQANARDLLRNGTYMVFRQLEQDVPAFEDFVASVAERLHGSTDPDKIEDVAARLVGRYRSGEPLVPRADDSPDKPDRNDFLFSHEDGAGLACPIGAHIRRANPRDAIGPDPDTALRLSKMHRIIRRGRPYGTRRDSEQGKSNGTGAGRGVAFIALNADIAGQFEMIQHSWLNNAHFGGLYSGTDPLGHAPRTGDEFAIQQRPTNVHVERPRPFVTVRGGAYFFLPGINAVRALATEASGH
ncbi:peroxidase [Tardiphaga sp.]|uniref:Dyp-type peroxidase n=1 Tax=Tardiphaga sp. TaxID=1926292 RepID=UPI00262651A9|nr:peroxidase [Tardiphaga sp.]